MQAFCKNHTEEKEKLHVMIEHLSASLSLVVQNCNNSFLLSRADGNFRFALLPSQVQEANYHRDANNGYRNFPILLC